MVLSLRFIYKREYHTIYHHAYYGQNHDFLSDGTHERGAEYILINFPDRPKKFENNLISRTRTPRSPRLDSPMVGYWCLKLFVYITFCVLREYEQICVCWKSKVSNILPGFLLIQSQT